LPLQYAASEGNDLQRQFSVVSGQLSVVSGQWSVVSCQLEARGGSAGFPLLNNSKKRAVFGLKNLDFFLKTPILAGKTGKISHFPRLWKEAVNGLYRFYDQ